MTCWRLRKSILLKTYSKHHMRAFLRVTTWNTNFNAKRRTLEQGAGHHLHAGAVRRWPISGCRFRIWYRFSEVQRASRDSGPRRFFCHRPTSDSCQQLPSNPTSVSFFPKTWISSLMCSPKVAATFTLIFGTSELNQLVSIRKSCWLAKPLQETVSS